MPSANVAHILGNWY